MIYIKNSELHNYVVCDLKYKEKKISMIQIAWGIYDVLEGPTKDVVNNITWWFCLDAN